MATANGISVELDEPPPRANANFAPSTRNRTPLATLAGRDPRSGSCAQKTISRTQQQKQQYIQCVHGTHACAQSGPGSAREISLNSACMTRPQEASVSGADLIQLSPALIVHDQQVSEQTLGFRAHQHSSVFNLDEVSFGGGFPEPTPQTATVRALPSAALFDSRQTPGAVPIASSRGLRTDTISRSQVAESRSQISPASKEVSLPLICNEATSSIPLLHQTTASAVSLLRPLVPERVGSVPLPTPASALPKQAVGTSVTAAVELLENQLFVVLQPPIVPPPLTFDNHTYQTNTLAVTAEQLGQQPSAQISTQFISTSTLVSNVSVPQNHPHSLSNDVSLQQTQPASNTANLHPTNPFLKDLQTASWNESAVSPLSYRDAARLDEAVMVSANSNGFVYFSVSSFMK
ncbi:unnamed protein product [Toxocara canis]|nr:unnamed protein product [Toxocara canis]